MALHCGIIGIANVGKTTLFNCISNTRAESSSYAFTSNKSNLGVINVPDERLYRVAELVKPQKITPATVDIVDIPGLTKGSSHGEGIGNMFLADIRNADALIHVLRCFDDENLPHIEGKVDPVRDKETIDLELQIKDLESVEKKVQKLNKLAKSGDKEAKKGVEVLEDVKNHLENLQNIRVIDINENDRKYIDDLFLLTGKPIMYVCNVDEKSVIHGNDYVKRVMESVRDEDTEVLVIAAALEAEIAELEDPEDRKEFLADAGLQEPGVNKLVRSAYRLLDRISFFTMSHKEVKAWTISQGVTVHKAAGVVHSDLERGFIRAEVIKFEDFIRFGSEQACRDAGKMALEGKNYVVRDGDIVYIRFNV